MFESLDEVGGEILERIAQRIERTDSIRRCGGLVFLGSDLDALDFDFELFVGDVDEGETVQLVLTVDELALGALDVRFADLVQVVS